MILKQIISSNGKTFGALILYPDDTNLAETNPIHVHGHGVGECANDSNRDIWLDYLLHNGCQALIRMAQQPYKGVNFITILPQLYRGDIYRSPENRNYTWPEWYFKESISWLMFKYKINPQRIYGSGLSLGGGGMLNLITGSEANARTFAAVATCCAVGVPDGHINVAKAKLPVAVYHAQDDSTVGFKDSFNFMNGVNALPECMIPVKGKFPGTGGHGVWEQMFNPAGDPYGNGLTVYDFFLMNKLLAPVAMPDVDRIYIPSGSGSGSGVLKELFAVDLAKDDAINVVGDTPLVLESEPVIGLVLPKAVLKPEMHTVVGQSQELDGSASQNAVAYEWKVISGPSFANLTSPKEAKTYINSFSKPGEYIIQLVVINKLGNRSEPATMKFIVDGAVQPKKLDYYLGTEHFDDNTTGVVKKLDPASKIIL